MLVLVRLLLLLRLFLVLMGLLRVPVLLFVLVAFLRVLVAALLTSVVADLSRGRGIESICPSQDSLPVWAFDRTRVVLRHCGWLVGGANCDANRLPQFVFMVTVKRIASHREVRDSLLWLLATWIGSMATATFFLEDWFCSLVGRHFHSHQIDWGRQTRARIGGVRGRRLLLDIRACVGLNGARCNGACGIGARARCRWTRGPAARDDEDWQSADS